MKIRIAIFLAFTSFILISCGGQSNKTNDPIVYAKSGDPELEKAKQEALSNLDYFNEPPRRKRTGYPALI